MDIFFLQFVIDFSCKFIVVIFMFNYLQSQDLRAALIKNGSKHTISTIMRILMTHLSLNIDVESVFHYKLG